MYVFLMYTPSTPCGCLLPVFRLCSYNVHLHGVSLAAAWIPKTHYELAQSYWLAVVAIRGPLLSSLCRSSLYLTRISCNSNNRDLKQFASSILKESDSISFRAIRTSWRWLLTSCVTEHCSQRINMQCSWDESTNELM